MMARGNKLSKCHCQTLILKTNQLTRAFKKCHVPSSFFIYCCKQANYHKMIKFNEGIEF
jgi:hypothetical protein